jgi:hypothetical protein
MRGKIMRNFYDFLPAMILPPFLSGIGNARLKRFPESR